MALEHVPSPPSGLAPRRDAAYFEITFDGPCAQTLRELHEIGVYVPDVFADASLELAILVPG
jgi:type VI secretion system protein ImpJ